MTRATILAAAAIVLLAGITLATSTSEAWARGGYYRGYDGGGWHGRHWYGPVYNQSVSRSPGHASGWRSYQWRGGYGYTRSFDRGCSGGSCRRSATTTTNSGKTWSRSGSGSKTGDSVNWRRNATGPHGSTVSRGGSCASGAGCAGSKTTVGSRGNAWTADRATTPNNQGGYNNSATFTGPNGTVTRSFETTRP